MFQYVFILSKYISRSEIAFSVGIRETWDSGICELKFSRFGTNLFMSNVRGSFRFHFWNVGIDYRSQWIIPQQKVSSFANIELCSSVNATSLKVKTFPPLFKYMFIIFSVFAFASSSDKTNIQTPELRRRVCTKIYRKSYPLRETLQTESTSWLFLHNFLPHGTDSFDFPLHNFQEITLQLRNTNWEFKLRFVCVKANVADKFYGVAVSLKWTSISVSSQLPGLSLSAHAKSTTQHKFLSTWSGGCNELSGRKDEQPKDKAYFWSFMSVCDASWSKCAHLGS